MLCDGRWTLTRFGQLIPSGNLSRLTEAGRDALLRYGRRMIIDARDPKEFAVERERFAPDAPWAGQVRYLNIR